VTRAAPAGWTTLAVTLAIQAMVSLAALAVPAMAPAMAAALQVSPTLVGTFFAVIYIGAMLASMLAGPLVIRFGAMRVSQAGLLLCALGLALLATTTWIGAAALAALLIGVGYGPITPASSHLLAKTTPAHRMALVFSLKQTGVPLGGVLAGAAVPALVLWGGPRSALLAVAAANLVCAVVAQPLRAALDEDRQPQQALGFASLTRPVGLVLGHPQLARLATFSFFFSVVQACLASYLVTFLNASLGYSLVAAGLVLSVAQAGGVVGRIAWGYIADRWLGPRRMLGTLAVLMTACAAATAGLQAGFALPLVLALMAAFGASGTGWNGVYLAQVARLAPPGMASAATGGSLALTFFGVVLGPVLFGGLAGLFDSYRVAFLALAVPTAFCAWSLFAGGKESASASG
jgi:MFS family permease